MASLGSAGLSVGGCCLAKAAIVVAGHQLQSAEWQTCLWHMSVHKSMYMSMHMSVHKSMHMSMHMSIHMSIHTYVYIHMSIHMFIHMYIHMSIHMSVYTSIESRLIIFWQPVVGLSPVWVGTTLGEHRA